MKTTGDNAEPIRQGQLFDASAAEETPSRDASAFTPSTALDTAPDSVAGAKSPNDNDVIHNIRLDAVPIKGLKQTLISLTVLVLVLFGWQLFTALQAAYNFHPLWGLTCLLGITSVLSFCAYSLWQVWRNGGQVEQLTALQAASSKLKPHKSFGKAAGFIAQLETFYRDKPQAVLLQKTLSQLPDYSNDAETLAHIERLFLLPLDHEALARVSKYATQTSVAVAASPWASLDMLLSLLRNVKMINEVGQVYGVRPSLLNRYKLFRQVALHLVGSGASEVIIDQAIQDLGASGLAQLLGLRLTQGLGAGLYSAKIGLSALAACRPILFADSAKPKLLQLLNAMILQVKSVLGRGY